MDDFGEKWEKDCLPAFQLLHIKDPDVIVENVHQLSDTCFSGEKVCVPDAELRLDVVVVDDDSKVEDSCGGGGGGGGGGQPRSCRLVESQLVEGLRVLVADYGLLHAGFVTAIRPPDIYGVVIDGERGGRPRIFSTEELLREAVSSHSLPLYKFVAFNCVHVNC